MMNCGWDGPKSFYAKDVSAEDLIVFAQAHGIFGFLNNLADVQVIMGMF